MKTENVERIKALLTEIAQICQEEKERYMSLSVMGEYINFNNDVKPKRRHFFAFSNDRGKTWNNLEQF